MDDLTVLGLTALMGATCGLRAFVGPVALSQAARRGDISLRKRPFRLLAEPGTRSVLMALAAGELIGDKLPFTPARTTPGSLLTRIATGAVCGAGLCAAARKRDLIGTGAVVGGAMAAGVAFAGYHLRKEAAGVIPDPLVAVAEDALTVGGALAAIAQVRPRWLPGLG